jgi:hypothetical protein
MYINNIGYLMLAVAVRTILIRAKRHALENLASVTIIACSLF